MPDWGALIRSAALPFVGAALGGAQAGSRQGVNMDEFNRVLAESAERKRQQAANRAQWEALRTITGGAVPPEQINAAEAAGLDPSMITNLMPQYTINPYTGEEIAQRFGQEPVSMGKKFIPRPMRGANPPKPTFLHDPGMPIMRTDESGNLVPVLGPDGKPVIRPFKPTAGRGADHYEERRVDQKEGALRVLFTQRRNALINALNPEQVKTQLPAIDEQITAGIEDLPQARQARWRKLLAKAQQTTAEPPPAGTPTPTAGPGLLDIGIAKIKQWLAPPATATPGITPEPGTRIRVRHKPTGQTGTIPSEEFDPALYDRLE